MDPKANPPDAVFAGFPTLGGRQGLPEVRGRVQGGPPAQGGRLLGSTPEPQRSELKRELDAIEAEFRAKSKAQFSVDEFVQRITSSGLMTVAEVSAFVSTLPADKQPKTAEELARPDAPPGPAYQVSGPSVYQGKTRGLVVGNYVVLDKLGQGGMGQVYKARHRKMERVVALKMLPSMATGVPDAVKRFERKVKAAARLSHPNIVTAYDADESGGMHFLVMEYVGGQNLRCW